MKTGKISIEGMSCASCVARVEKSILKTLGVKSVGVNLATENATVTYDSAETDLAEIIDGVNQAGYKAQQQKAISSPNSEEDVLKSKAMRKEVILSSMLCIPFLIGMVTMFYPVHFLHSSKQSSI